MLLKKIVIIVIVLFVLLSVIGVYFFFHPGTTSSVGNIVTTNPFGETAIPQNNQVTPHNVTGGGTINVSGMQVNDFTKGSGVSTSTDTDNYFVLYPEKGPSEYEINYQTDQSFVIGIFKEPIGEVRAKAATDLENRLGVSASEACSLSVFVRVPEWVNETYANENLGLPGCPGATPLPGD